MNRYLANVVPADLYGSVNTSSFPDYVTLRTQLSSEPPEHSELRNHTLVPLKHYHHSKWRHGIQESVISTNQRLHLDPRQDMKSTNIIKAHSGLVSVFQAHRPLASFPGRHGNEANRP